MDSSDIRPIPDPTILTTAQLLREMEGLRRELGMIRECLTESIEAEKHFILKEIERVSHLTESHFALVAMRFGERDERFALAARDKKEAIQAAMASVTKQIDQQGILIQTNANVHRDMIDECKGRLTLIEGRSSGMGASWGIAMSLLGTFIALGALAIALVRHSSCPVLSFSPWCAILSPIPAPLATHLGWFWEIPS